MRGIVPVLLVVVLLLAGCTKDCRPTDSTSSGGTAKCTTTKVPVGQSCPSGYVEGSCP